MTWRLAGSLPATAVTDLWTTRTGSFWAKDYFDRWIRERNECEKIIRYVDATEVACPVIFWTLKIEARPARLVRRRLQVGADQREAI